MTVNSINWIELANKRRKPSLFFHCLTVLRCSPQTESRLIHLSALRSFALSFILFYFTFGSVECAKHKPKHNESPMKKNNAANEFHVAKHSDQSYCLDFFPAGSFSTEYNRLMGAKGRIKNENKRRAQCEIDSLAWKSRLESYRAI